MDLKVLYALMRERGFHYSDCRTYPDMDDMYFDFSTGFNGRGNIIEIRLSDTNNDIKMYLGDDLPIELCDASFGYIIKFIRDKTSIVE